MHDAAVHWVVGLGNPGQRYSRTRHNVGFMVLDELARDHKAIFRGSWFYRAQRCEISAGRVVLVKPQTYMNRSGLTVGRLKFWRRYRPERLIVVVDDTALEPGRIRIRKKGSAGGHNGLKSLNSTLKTEEFVRIRVGVGSSFEKGQLVDYVLSAFSEDQLADIEKGIKTAAKAVEYIVEHGADKAMNTFNK